MTRIFRYKARDFKGGISEGIIEAENENLVARRLREQGYYVTSIEKEKQEKGFKAKFKRLKKVNIKDLAFFSRQFATMTKAGLSLVKTLNILSDQIANPKLEEAVISVREKIEEGMTLSNALGTHDDIFPPIFISMVEAGEAGGALDKVLEELADHFEKENDLKQKITSAVAYPAVIAVVAILAICFLVFGVLPIFLETFAQLDAQLPLITRGLIRISELLTAYWYLVVAVLLGVIGGGYFYYKTEKGKKRVDWLLLKIPVFGDLFTKLAVARFSKTLGILLSSGVPILEGLRIVSKIITNRVIASRISSARKNISEGESITTPLARDNLFPQMVLQMIKVGEESGDLEGMLKKVADFYEKEVEHKVEGIISLIEPVLIVVLGSIVALIVISIMFPLFDLLQKV